MPFTPAFGNSTISPGLDVVQAVDAGDAVTDGQHLADVRDGGFFAEIGDLRLEDGRNLGGADVHGCLGLSAFLSLRRLIRLGALQGEFQGSSFERSEASNRREPTRTLMPPRMDGSTRVEISGVLPTAVATAAATPLSWAAVRAVAGGDLGGDDATLIGRQLRRKRVMAPSRSPARPLAGHQAQELGGQQLELGLGRDGDQTLGLVLGRRRPGCRSDGAGRRSRPPSPCSDLQVGFDLGQLVALDRQFEQGLRIALTRIRRLGFVRHLFRPVRCNRRGQEV